MSPSKHLNIIVLGQTGVGKSTWIASAISHLRYGSFEDVKTTTHAPIYEPDEENIGSAVTKSCIEYVVDYKNTIIKFIDTPGVGDTRSLDQDKVNFKMILDHIQTLDYLHGICILMKSGETRLNIVFRFCITELLKHLHKDAINNVVFCFTNTIGVLGESSLFTLKKLFIEMKIDFPFHNRCFYIDNISYKYLSTTNRSRYDANDVKIFRDTWKSARGEVKKIIELITSLKPHNVKDTLSINNIRQTISILVQVYGDLTEIIESSLIILEHFKQEVDDLTHKKSVTIPKTIVDVKTFQKPKTACVKCVKDGNFKICHDRCVEVRGIENFPDKKIQKCQIFEKKNCKICHCSWKEHMQIFYSFEKKIVEEPIDEMELLAISDEVDRKKLILDKIQTQINKFNEDKDVIFKSAAANAVFLKNNSITTYNDAMAQYLELLIEKQQNNPNTNVKTEKLVEKLKENHQKYIKEVEFYEEVNSSKNSDIITVEDIQINLGETEERLTFSEVCRKMLDVAKLAVTVYDTFQPVLNRFL